MKYGRLVEKVAKRTGLPRNVVRHVLDTMCDVVRAELLARGEVHFPKLLKLTSDPRRVRLPDFQTGDMKDLERVTLRIRPMESFRQELSRWTSTG